MVSTVVGQEESVLSCQNSHSANAERSKQCTVKSFCPDASAVFWLFFILAFFSIYAVPLYVLEKSVFPKNSSTLRGEHWANLL